MSTKVLILTSLKSLPIKDLSQKLVSDLGTKFSKIEHIRLFGENGVFGIEETEEMVSNGNKKELSARLIKAVDLAKKVSDLVVVESVDYGQFNSSIAFADLDLARDINACVASFVDLQNAKNENVSIKNELKTINDKGLEVAFIFAVNAKSSSFDSQNVQILHNNNFDVEFLHKRLQNVTSDLITGIAFENELFAKAKKNKKTIVLPEGDEPRTLTACETLLKNQVVDIVLLGEEAKIKTQIASLKLDLEGIQIIDPSNSSLTDEFANDFYEMRKAKGLSLEDAKKSMLDVSYFGTMMVQKGLAHGMVSGAVHTTADTVRPALQIIKTAPGISVVSSVFFMCVDTRVLIFGDCAVNPNPSENELAQIAISSADTAKSFGFEPKIAMLSYSTGTSGMGADVEKVAKATQIVREQRPDLQVDGPLQFDAAIMPSVAKSKMPNSEVAGKANVLIFPDLNTGNNTYKAVQRLAGAVAVGPVLQGLKKPVNDLSRGCLVDDIINTVAITAIQGE